VQNLQKRDQPIAKNIQPLDVCQLVQKHVAQFHRRQRFQHVLWQQQTRANESQQRRALNFVRQHHAHRHVNLQLAFAIFQKTQHLAIDERAQLFGVSEDAEIHITGSQQKHDDAEAPQASQKQWHAQLHGIGSGKTF